ncbi:MAG: hypothetical protein WD851_09905 [Pirellulales bacterium]
MKRLAILTFFGLSAAIALGSAAIAQEGRDRRDRGDSDREERRDDGDRRGDRDRDDDRGRDGDRRGGDSERGRGSWSGRGWGDGGNPEDFWKRFDRNEDGMIAPDEVDERFRDRLGIDKPTKIEDLASRFRRDRESRDRDDRDGGNRDNNNSSAPAVAGFGVAANENAKVPGFGPPEKPVQNQAEQSEARPSSQSTAAKSGEGESNEVTSDTFINSVFKENDSNTNGVLEGEEIAAAGKQIPPKADGDGDGRVTRDELIAAVGTKSPSGGESSKEAPTGRRSYRFASAHERLPDSAKSWIVSRDKNGDGQVAMHEFSRTWSDSKIREFQRYDLNGDSVITAAEYVAK